MQNPQARALIAALLKLYEDPSDAIADVAECSATGPAPQRSVVEAKKISDAELITRVLERGPAVTGVIVLEAQKLEPRAKAASLRTRINTMAAHGTLTKRPAPEGAKGMLYELNVKRRRAR